MRESVRRFMSRATRWSAAASLVIVALVIVFHFVFRRPKAVDTSPDLRKSEAVKTVNRQSNVSQTFYTGKETRLVIYADRSSTTEDGYLHFEGNVRVEHISNTGARKLDITADKADVGKNNSFIEISGNVVVKDGETVLRSPCLDYDNQKDVFSTDEGVVLTSPRLKARARNLIYFERFEELRFGGDIDLEILPRTENPEPFKIRGDKFLYNRKGKFGTVDGNVHLTRGENTADADTMTFILSPDEQDIKSMILRGGAKTEFFRSDAAGVPGSGEEIEAQEISFLSMPGEGQDSGIKAQGDCLMKIRGSGEKKDEIRAGTIIVVFDSDGVLKDFSSTGDSRMALAGGKPGEEKTIRGDRIVYNKEGDLLRAFGIGNIPARFDSGRIEINAEMIGASLEAGDLQASGGVRSILKPSSAGAAIGFFSKESPVLITSRNLKYVKKDKRFDFKTDVRIWQDKNLIAAKDIEIGEENGEVSGRGAVKAVFVRPAKGRGGEEERLEIASDRMSYSPKDRQIAFTGNASLVTPELRLTAAGLAIYLSEKGNEMERLLAKGKVVIVQTGREGSGENADYDFSADTLVLTGKQVILIDKEQGRTEGTKLTFNLANDNIRVEDDRGRSTTVRTREQ